MAAQQINGFLHSFDLDLSQNEFHKGWRDVQLNFNYFMGTDSTGYYGTFGSGNPNMRFNDWDTAPVEERTHIDIYLNHPAEGRTDTFPPSLTFPPDIAEDGDPSTCCEYPNNAVQATAGYAGMRNPSNPWNIDVLPDSLWFVGGKHTSVRINHETQHLIQASRTPAPVNGAFYNEMFSMSAEYLVGAQLRDVQRPVYNTIYDWPIGSGASGPAYSAWYLLSTYLLQQHPADTTKVEDDLYYRWIRQEDGSGRVNNSMLGLARVLDDNAYSSLGGAGARPGDERLRNLYHNYAVAKWLNNPSPSFYGGKYGFTRGVVPSWTGPYFDNSFNPRDRRSATEVPPKFVVRQAQISADLDSMTHWWCVTDHNQGSGGNISRETCDSVAVFPYGGDYIQLEADPYFETNGKPNMLRFKMTWDPSKVPGTFPAGNNLRVTAVTYPIRSDSLYRYGGAATQVIDACVDKQSGTAQIGIPNFGSTTKSVVIVIDLADDRPESTFIFATTRRLFYDYALGVDTISVPTVALDLAAHRPSPTSPDSITWSDPQRKGMFGYYIQRSIGNPSTMTVIDSCNCGVYTKVATPPGGQSVTYYRVLSKANPLWISNLATPGGLIEQTQSLAGKVYVSGDITVTAGDTLIVAPGTQMTLRPNFDSQASGADANKSEVIVDGHLRAIGTAADSIIWQSAKAPPAPGDWRGIKFNSPGAGSRLEYNIVRHANHGVQVVSTTGVHTFKIHRSRIQHSQQYGLYIQGGYPEILYSVLEQNHGAELAVTNYGSPKIANCHLRYAPELGAGAVDDGAVYTTSGGGTMRYCSINGVGMGLYCVGGNPALKGVASAPDSLMYGRNSIVDFRNYGVRTIDANPNLGYATSPTSYFSSRNNIYTTIAPSAPYVSHSSSTTLNARWNYWGANPPDMSRFIGSIDDPVSAYLTSLETPSGPGFNPAGTPLSPQDRVDDAADMYEIAWAKEASFDHDGAASDYREIIRLYPDDRSAVMALAQLLTMQGRIGRARDELAYADSLARGPAIPTLRNTARRLRPPLLLRAGETDSALAAYDSLLADSEFDRGGILFELALQKGLVLRDTEGARAAVIELQSCCADPSLMKHARAMLQEVVGHEVWLVDGAGESAAQLEAPTNELELEQSSPNPMNPRARIAFRTPREGHATLRIYDVQGRAVRTLVDSELAPGRHVVDWDGRTGTGNVIASGVYYYRLEFGGKSLVRKAIVLK